MSSAPHTCDPGATPVEWTTDNVKCVILHAGSRAPGRMYVGQATRFEVRLPIFLADASLDVPECWIAG